MKFSTREDIEAPIQTVFEMLCDFEKFERAAMRRGAEVQRTDSLTAPGVGASWDIRFMLRGKDREMSMSIVTFQPPEHMVVALSSSGVTGSMEFELIALSRRRTRILIGLELRPQTLPARLLIQSLKLTKTSLNKKYKERIATYIEDMEDRLRGTT